MAISHLKLLKAHSSLSSSQNYQVIPNSELVFLSCLMNLINFAADSMVLSLHLLREHLMLKLTGLGMIHSCMMLADMPSLTWAWVDNHWHISSTHCKRLQWWECLRLLATKMILQENAANLSMPWDKDCQKWTLVLCSLDVWKAIKSLPGCGHIFAVGF